MKENEIEIKSNKEIIAYIKCKSCIKKIILPEDYDNFKEKICNMIQINEGNFSKLKIFYIDEDNDSVILNEKNDYTILLNEIEEKTTTIINIELNKDSDIDLDKCSKNMEKFKEENEEINELNTSQKIENNNQEKLQIKEIVEDNNKNEIILNNKYSENEENNINNNNININIDNNFTYSDDENGNGNGDLILNNKEIKENEININTGNQLNYANNININNNNIYINNANNNINAPLTRTYITFPLTCDLCGTYPIIKVLYYCPKCAIPICENCEDKSELKHRHLIFKVQTNDQYQDLISKVNSNNQNKDSNNEVNQSQFQKFKNSIINLFGNNKEENNNQNQGNPQHMSIIQIARQSYDLRGVSDNELEQAINRANGNIEEALPLLINKQ